MKERIFGAVHNSTAMNFIIITCNTNIKIMILICGVKRMLRQKGENAKTGERN